MYRRCPKLGDSGDRARTRTTFDLGSYIYQPLPSVTDGDTFSSAYALFGSATSQVNHYYRPCLRNLVVRFHEYLHLLRDLLAERKIAVSIVSIWEEMHAMPINTGPAGDKLNSHYTLIATKRFFNGEGIEVGYFKKRADFLKDLTMCTHALGADPPEGIVYSTPMVKKLLADMRYEGNTIIGLGHVMAVVSDEMFNFAHWLKNLLNKLGYGHPGALKITRLEMEVRALKVAVQKLGGKVVVPAPPVHPGPLGPSDADSHEDWDDYRVGQNAEFNSLQDLLGMFQLYKKRFPQAATYERRAKHCYSREYSKQGASALFQHFLDSVGIILDPPLPAVGQNSVPSEVSSATDGATEDEDEEFFDALPDFEDEISEGQNDEKISTTKVPVTEPVVEDVGDVKLMFDSEEVLVQEIVDQPRPFLHPNMAVLQSGSFEIPLQAVRGSYLASFSLGDLKIGNGPLVEELKRCNSVDGHLYVTMKCSMTIAAGCCIAVVYCESGHSTNDAGEMRRLLLRPHRLWNPACESAIKFSIQPWACANHFHIDFLDKGMIYFAMVSGWNPAPHNPPSVVWDLSYSPEKYTHQAPIDVMSLPGELKYKSYLGTMSFNPMDSSVRVVEANLGKPCVVGASYGYGLWQSLLGCYSYWLGDVVLDLARGSSPMIGALVGVAVIPSSQTLSPQSLITYPHIEVEFGPGRTVKRVLLPSHLFRHNASSERHDLFNSNHESHTLAIWPIHYTSSSTGDPFVLTAVVVGVRNLSVSGFSPGYLMDRGRLSSKVKAVLNYDMDYYEVSDGQLDDWHLITSGGPKNTNFVRFFPPATDMVSRTSSLSKLLHTCCWVKGRFVGKVVWMSNGTVTRADWKTVLVAKLFLGIGSHASNQMATSEPAGEWQFEFEMMGPVNGFLAHWEFPGQKWGPKLSFECLHPESLAAVLVYLKPLSMHVSGVGVPLWLPAAK